MSKVKYNNITFDSELEVEYYKLIKNASDKGMVIYYMYHPSVPIQITKTNTYTPDFIVVYHDRVEIIETKGYNPYSKMRDDMIHQVMLDKPENELRNWVNNNVKGIFIHISTPVLYKKIKYLKSVGWVDFDFKNPNTLANKRKEKIDEQKSEIKELRDFKKDALRYFSYHLKLVNNKNLTKPQREWYLNYIDRIKVMIDE